MLDPTKKLKITYSPNSFLLKLQNEQQGQKICPFPNKRTNNKTIDPSPVPVLYQLSISHPQNLSLDENDWLSCSLPLQDKISVKDTVAQLDDGRTKFPSVFRLVT